MTDIRKRQHARFYIYRKQKNFKRFILKKTRHFSKKQDNFRYVFIYKKHDTLRYGIFHEIFEVGIYIQNA